MLTKYLITYLDKKQISGSLSLFTIAQRSVLRNNHTSFVLLQAAPQTTVSEMKTVSRFFKKLPPFTLAGLDLNDP
jgi:hypothetical protein